MYRTCNLTCNAGFSEIMGTLARIGFFDTKAHPVLNSVKRPTYGSFLLELLKVQSENLAESLMGENNIAERILVLGLCKEQGTAVKTAKTIL